MNAQSITEKIDYIMDIFDYNNIDIGFINETWLCNDYKKKLALLSPVIRINYITHQVMAEVKLLLYW